MHKIVKMNNINNGSPYEWKENFDSTNACRVCLTNNITMSRIFDDKKKIIDKIEFCTGILLKEEEGISTQICINCLTNLSIAHKFKTSCLLSEQIFQKVLLNRVKIEIPINDDNTHNDNYVLFNVNDYDSVEIKNETLEAVCEVYQGHENSKINVQKSRLQKAKVKENSKPEKNSPVKKRGPYKKGGPPRKKKYKYKKLYCEICKIKFTSKEESNNHKKKHIDNFMCEVCGKAFLHYNSFYSHVRCHLPPTYLCAHCDYGCTNRHDLVKHLRIHLGIKNYKCVKCSATFHTSSSLRDHERRIHTGALKRFACFMCEKLFRDKSKLNRHIDSHNQIKRYSCDHCPSSFTRRCYWKKHLEKQHNVIIPPQRPGRQKSGYTLVTDKI